jgi:hypothetical protein
MIDSIHYSVPWGETFIPVSAGRYVVRVSCGRNFFGDIGAASVALSSAAAACSNTTIARPSWSRTLSACSLFNPSGASGRNIATDLRSCSTSHDFMSPSIERSIPRTPNTCSCISATNGGEAKASSRPKSALTLRRPTRDHSHDLLTPPLTHKGRTEGNDRPIPHTERLVQVPNPHKTCPANLDPIGSRLESDGILAVPTR